MKKFLTTALLTVSACLALVGCGSDKTEQTTG